ncbi:MAG: hypothetical protein FWD61_19025, partial [Phycisphaerales bacterium]|nr:hypothetical protein [Phycisphaerales bacterium]
LNMLQRETSRKISFRVKRLHAGWHHDYLLHILQHGECNGPGGGVFRRRPRLTPPPAEVTLLLQH